ncbi:uncharacterized protein BJX67DRAFT_107617 [Aspergillus lucknowensis]|uniref:STEEP1 domain-containing protein n=1 Tax=Aspergillus lucknowensis TaxID=176173 RepID=A0ABR4LSU1_9EURO
MSAQPEGNNATNASVQPQTPTQTQTRTPSPARLPITTHHCRFCTTLILATTRDIASLPQRSKNAMDGAQILPLRSNPLPNSDREGGQEGGMDVDTDTDTTKHYTILLATSIRDRKPTMIRREDGFEKRFFLRCARCRLVMGYFLDEVHFPAEGGLAAGSGVEGEDRAVYLLPGALMETEIMSDEDKMRAIDREWSAWFRN